MGRIALYFRPALTRLASLVMLPSHPILSFVASKNKHTALVSIKKDVDKETYQVMCQFLDENFKRNGDNRQWLVKSEEVDELCNEVDNIVDQLDNPDEESDDELIQEALARRFKSESSLKSIDETEVNDSEDEDVISLCRRMRGLYRTIEGLKKEVEELKRG